MPGRGRARRFVATGLMPPGELPYGTPLIDYQLRDEFLTDRAAPMGTNPITRTCEPGPGPLNLVQRDGVAEWFINGGILQTTTGDGSPSILWGRSLNPFTRAQGLAVKMRAAQNPNGTGASATVSPMLGWSGTPTTTQTAVTGLAYNTAGGGFFGSDYNAGLTRTLSAIASSVYYDFVIVLGATGGISVLDGKIEQIHVRDNTASMYPIFGQYANVNRHTPALDYIRVAQLGGPWASANFANLTTARLPGARSVNDTFSHDANAFWLQLTLPALPSTGRIDVDVRRQDANNCWRLSIDNAGVIRLFEVVGGVESTRVSIAGGAGGDTLLLGMDGQRAIVQRKLASGADVNTALYESVSTFTTQTSGIISSLGTGGAVSDLVTWPRTLSGDALAWINAL